MKFFYLIIALEILTGCNNRIKDPVLSDFSKVVNLKSTVSNIKSSELGEIVDMIIVDSVIVINEMFSDYIFKLFNIKTGEIISNCIRKGRGPDEMISPHAITSYKQDVFSTYANNMKQLIYISIGDLLKNNHKFHKTEKIEILDAFKAYPINDSLIICTGMFKEGRYCLYNKNSKKKIIKFDYPYDEKHEGESNVGKGLAFQGRITIKPDLTKFVMACSSSGNIEIYRLLNNNFERVFRKIYFLPQYENINNRGARFSSENKLAFISLSSNEKYIYVIYSGHIEKSDSDYYNGKNLLVYDWEGQPILNFKLDRNIMIMDIEKNSMKMYGYCINTVTGEPEIVIYELPEH